ncbi:MAG: molybdopterin-synthase adenylyltransferase MoeB [Cyclobacteriaceae bacterium]|nr:molybdopterin-synthase adenylyltransferase MoeB [Cyclobacteriaceae bacterium]
MNKEELTRYSRHITLPEMGVSGQQKLKEGKVLVVGAGGLGAPLLLYLSAAGIGEIGIIDDDIVEDSNLQRQVLFTTDDIGKPKAITAKKRIELLNPYIKVTSFNERLTTSNALEIIKKYDVVADGTDNFATRYLVNDACVLLNKINVYASIFRFEGQVSVFNYPQEDSPNYRDLFPAPPPPGLVPNCAEGGVLGVLPGIIGSIQANEVIKLIAQIGKPLVGRMFIFDTLLFESRIIKFSIPKNRTLINGLIDYEEFCNIGNSENSTTKMKEVTVHELKSMFDNNQDFQLIDVRKEHEYQIANINGELIPMEEIFSQVEKIKTNKKVVVHCLSGVRSANVILKLEEEFGFDNLYNLKGGILAWSDEIDASIPKY